MAVRSKPGTISERSSSHLPPSEDSSVTKPVMFPLGRASRATRPLLTGSATVATTIGIVRVSRWRATVAGVALVRMMSGCRPTSSCASARIRLLSPPAHRRSIRTSRPLAQPRSASACMNAERRVLYAGSFSSLGMSTLMRRTRSFCCARATAGHSAALPSPAMNARRFIGLPRRPRPTAFPGW
jgi:hypothetical protein